MGVPAFYRWHADRYSLSISGVIEEKVVDLSRSNPNGVKFDSLYLDMNGTIYPCFYLEGRVSSGCGLGMGLAAQGLVACSRRGRVRKEFELEGGKLSPLEKPETADSNVITPGI